MGRSSYSHILLMAVFAAIILTPALHGQLANAEPPSGRFFIGKPLPPAPQLGLSARQISLDVRSADIRSVLRLLAKESGTNIVPSPQVRGDITITLKQVPLREAFLSILRAQNLTWERQGPILLVSPNP